MGGGGVGIMITIPHRPEGCIGREGGGIGRDPPSSYGPPNPSTEGS